MNISITMSTQTNITVESQRHCDIRIYYKHVVICEKYVFYQRLEWGIKSYEMSGCIQSIKHGSHTTISYFENIHVISAFTLTRT